MLNAEQLSEKWDYRLIAKAVGLSKGLGLHQDNLFKMPFHFLKSRVSSLKPHKNYRTFSARKRLGTKNMQGQKYCHEVVILANGYKITDFVQTEKLPLYPIRGQVSQIPTSENLLKLKSVLCYDGYLTPANQLKPHIASVQAMFVIMLIAILANKNNKKINKNSSKISPNLGRKMWIHQIISLV